MQNMHHRVYHHYGEIGNIRIILGIIIKRYAQYMITVVTYVLTYSLTRTWVTLSCNTLIISKKAFGVMCRHACPYICIYLRSRNEDLIIIIITF